MALIPRDIVDAVRDRTDIVEIVSRSVKLERRGSSWVGLCPFHQEKSPSFNVIPGKALYYCFGCQAAGDVFRFLMLTENLSFFESVQQLANAAGITIETREQSDEERRRYRARASLYDLMEEATQWFESQLWTTSDGAPARAYLERRAMAESFAHKVRLGWAPGGWTKLVEHLQRRGFSAELVAQGGLSRQSDRGDRIYDTFRERLIIPIRDERGRVIAFGGRLLEGEGPKYINSPETELYKKGEVLYGLDLAQNHIRAKGSVILVEGYFDVLSLQQAGFGEAIATCGTALSEQHADKLAKIAREITLLTDSDTAGENAAERIEEKYLLMLVRRGVSAWRLSLPDAKDPDELIRERGTAAMEAALKSRVNLLYWVAQRKLARHGYTAEARQRILDESAPLLAELTPIARAEFAGYTRINEDLVHKAAQRAPRAPNEAPKPLPDDDPWRPTKEIVHLVWLLVHRYDQTADLLSRADARVFDDHPRVLPLIARLLEGEPAVRILDDLTDVVLRKLLTAAVAREALYPPDGAAQAALQQLARLWRPRHDALIAAANATAVQKIKSGDPQGGRAALATVQAGRDGWNQVERALASGDIESALSQLTKVSTRLTNDAPS
jgi:DNA primase